MEDGLGLTSHKVGRLSQHLILSQVGVPFLSFELLIT